MDEPNTPDTTEHEATQEGMPEAVSDAPVEMETSEAPEQGSER